MKIGYLRFSLPFIADPTIYSSTLGFEGRFGIISALIDQGHEVTVYSQIRGNDDWVYQSHKDVPETNYDLKNLRKINYEPVDFPVDEDVLWIEKSPTNVLFSVAGVPHIYRTFQCIDKFKGNVFYHQDELTDMSFPFNVQRREVSERSKSYWNLRRMGQRIDSFFKDKDWTIFTHYRDVEGFLDNVSEGRFNYKYFMKEEGMKVNYLLPRMSRFAPHFNTNSSPPWDLIYIGNNRDDNRRMKLKKFYSSPELFSGVHGEWNGVNLDHIVKLGTCSYDDCIKKYNTSTMVVQITDEVCERHGIITNRIPQCLYAGVPVLIDKDIYGGRELFGDNYLVGNKDDVIDKVKEFREMDVYEKEAHVMYQKNRIGYWEDINWEKVLLDGDTNVL